MQRLRSIRRALVSLFWVSAAFVVYTFCVAPFVESSYEVDDVEEDNQQLVDEERSSDRFVRELTDLFPEGSWELDRPKVLRSQQATILLNDFEQQGDSLRIKKCSLVFYGSNRDQQDPNRRGPIILQAPEGAILDFDKPIDLTSGLISRPVGGKLVGNVRIFSAGGSNSEDLELTTRNVVITDQRIWTPEQVFFRLGTNYGSGHYLIIERATDRSDSKGSKAWLAGLGRIELQRLERLTVQMAGEDMFDSIGASPAAAVDGDKNDQTTPSTIELRCDGPLHFDLQAMIATVDDHVRITRTRVGEPTDTLQASKVSLRWARVQPPDHAVDGPTTGQVSKPKLSVTRIVAVGEPLTIDAPSRQTYVETNRLEYDFDSKQIRLRGFQPFRSRRATESTQPTSEVRIQTPLHALAAPEVDLVGGADRREWQMHARGSGRYLGIPSGDPQQQVSARWTEQLALTPRDNQQVLSLQGGASLQAPGVGSLQADRIELWVEHTTTVVAHRLDGSVVQETVSRPTKLMTVSKPGGRTTIESPRFAGSLSKLTVHFEPAAAGGSAAAAPLLPWSRGPATDQQGTTLAESPRAKYHIEGGEVTAWISSDTQQLRQIAIRGETRMHEVSSPAVGSTFQLVGNWIDYHVAADGSPVALLRGTPAMLTASRLHVTGSTIELAGDQNRLEIPAAGSLRIKIPDGLVAQANSPAGHADRATDNPQRAAPRLVDLLVHWQGSLVFDGQVAEIKDEVTVTADDLTIRTRQLDVGLRDRLQFARLGATSTVQPQVREIRAAGGIVAANRSRDKTGTTTGYQQMVAQDFYLDYVSGETTAHGPGWLSMTTQDEDTGSTATSSREPTSSPQPRMQLSVAFARLLEGNLHERSCRLSDDVRCWYGPVMTWEDRIDPVQPRSLQANELRLTCRELYVLESPTALDSPSRKPIELLARGETYIESERYAAKGHQIKFAEDKGMLTLEGDLQRPAELWQRNLASGKFSHSGRARTIRYWPQSGQVEIKFLGLDLSQTPQTTR